MVTPDTPADATDASAEQVLVQRHGARVDIVLNRPQQHNAMTPAMYGALTQAFRELADDIDARVVVLRGAGGRAFAAGNDIAGFAGRSGAEIVADYESRVMGMLDALFGAAASDDRRGRGHLRRWGTGGRDVLRRAPGDG